MKYLLGIDVGTTGTKSLLFRQDGLLVAQAYRGYPTMTPSVGRSEQDPRDWWRAVTETVRQLCADEEISKNVAAISLSLQGGTVVSVDAAMEPKEEEPEEEQQAVEDTAYFQMRQRIMELLSTLSAEDAQLLTLRYGLEGGMPLNPEEAGRKLGMTPQEVVTREANALAKLRQQG